jgi:hypothetical protein
MTSPNKGFPTLRNNTMDMLTRAKWFMALDLKGDYWQVALHPDYRKDRILQWSGAVAIQSYAF